MLIPGAQWHQPDPRVALPEGLTWNAGQPGSGLGGRSPRFPTEPAASTTPGLSPAADQRGGLAPVRGHAPPEATPPEATCHHHHHHPRPRPRAPHPPEATRPPPPEATQPGPGDAHPGLRAEDAVQLQDRLPKRDARTGLATLPGQAPGLTARSITRGRFWARPVSISARRPPRPPCERAEPSFPTGTSDCLSSHSASGRPGSPTHWPELRFRGEGGWAGRGTEKTQQALGSQQSPLGHAVTGSPNHPKHAEPWSASSLGPSCRRAGVGRTPGGRSEASPSRLPPPWSARPRPCLQPTL